MKIPHDNADLDEACPITAAIDRGGGQGCDIAGVLRELDKAGFVIGPKQSNLGGHADLVNRLRQPVLENDYPAILASHLAIADMALAADILAAIPDKIGTDFDITKASAAIRAFAQELLSDTTPPQWGTVDRLIVMSMQVAWADAIRQEWKAHVEATPSLQGYLEVAKAMMLNDGYNMDDPIVGVPGAVPMVAKIDGHEAVCYNHSMNGATTLSAVYLSKVLAVMRVADEVKAKEGTST